LYDEEEDDEDEEEEEDDEESDDDSSSSVGALGGNGASGPVPIGPSAIPVNADAPTTLDSLSEEDDEDEDDEDEDEELLLLLEHPGSVESRIVKHSEL